MALVSLRVTVTVQDAWGSKAAMQLYAQADDTASLASIRSEASAALTKVYAINGGQFVDPHVTIALDAFGGSPDNIARVEQTGLLGFSVTGSTRRYTLAIPALFDSDILPDGRIDLTPGSDVLALIAVLTTVGTALTFCNNYNQPIGSFLDATTAFRKFRKQLQRSSFEV